MLLFGRNPYESGWIGKRRGDMPRYSIFFTSDLNELRPSAHAFFGGKVYALPHLGRDCRV
jgi:hypothetical protein